MLTRVALLSVVAGCACAVNYTTLMFQGDSSTADVKYSAFMVPGLVAVRGVLMAFAEGRTYTCQDWGKHDLVLRRSVDDGKTWEPLRTILDPTSLGGCNETEACLPYTDACQTGKGKVCGGGCAVWDPTPVADEVTGEVHVLFGRSTTSCHGGSSTAGARKDMWIMSSADLGATWSAPRDVTAECSTPYGGEITGAGGHGIQLSGGKELIIPLYAGVFHCAGCPVSPPAPQGGQGVCKSDDHGKTWRSGGVAAPLTGAFNGPFEGEVVELFEKAPSGGPRLMYDTRVDILPEAKGSYCGGGVQGCRVTYLSDDLGDTWHSPTPDPERPDPSCKGGIVRYDGAAGRALFSVNPASTTYRVNTTVYASVDNGATFNTSLLIDASGGYSTAQVTRSGHIAAFYNYYGTRNSSIAAPGGCSFKLATMDPSELLPPRKATAAPPPPKQKRVSLKFHPPVIVGGKINTTEYHKNTSALMDMLGPIVAVSSFFQGIEQNSSHIFGELQYTGDVFTPDGKAGCEYDPSDPAHCRFLRKMVVSKDSGATWGYIPDYLPGLGGVKAFTRPRPGVVRSFASDNHICAGLDNGVQETGGACKGSTPPPWTHYSSDLGVEYTMAQCDDTCHGKYLAAKVLNRTTIFHLDPAKPAGHWCGGTLTPPIGIQGDERTLNLANMLTLPDGSLLTAAPLCLGDRYVGDVMRKKTNVSQYTITAFRSTDGGANWNVWGVVANPNDYPTSIMGPTAELDLSLLADGKTLLAIMRNDGDCNCARSALSKAGIPSDCGIYVSYDQSYSTDNGRTWQVGARLTGMGCVWPRLHLFPTAPTLGASPLLLSGGRNCAANRTGLSVWLNPDGMASAADPRSTSIPWTEFSVSYQHNRMWQGDSAYLFDDGVNASNLFGTEAYTTLLPLADPSSALLIYNKYFHPADGVPGCFWDRTPAGKPVGYCSTGFAMRIDVVVE